MPFYSLYCECGEKDEVFRTIAEIEKVGPPMCPCGRKFKIDVGENMRFTMIEGHGRKPYYDRGLGRTVKSAFDADRVAKEMGVKRIHRDYGE